MCSRCLCAIVALFFAFNLDVLAQDTVSAPDYPGVGRVHNYFAFQYQVTRFDALEFQYHGKTMRVEGRKFYGQYQCDNNKSECTSVLGLQKEFEAVLRHLGGEVLVKDPVDKEDDHGFGRMVGRFGANGEVVYLDVQPWQDGSRYILNIIEEKAFVPTTISATGTVNDLAASLASGRKVVLYINFDFDKAELKPDAGPIIQQIVSALQGETSMNLEIHGYTDSIGTDARNKELSGQRADAVRAAVQRMGIYAARFSAFGHGPSAPIADNGTSDSRAQNRRVDLVKKT